MVHIYKNSPQFLRCGTVWERNYGCHKRMIKRK